MTKTRKRYLDDGSFSGQVKDDPCFENIRCDRRGRVINIKTGFELKPYRMKKGHAQVSISYKGKVKKFLVHRIVAKSFLARVKGKDHVNHKNGDPFDNRVENLEWCTDRENKTHAKENGMFQQSTGRYNASFDEAQILTIHTLPWSQAAIARHYKSHTSVICNIKNFKTYKNFAVIK